jgi:hypothetical protein
VSESFQSDELNTEFRRLDLQVEKKPDLEEEQAPPSKRRRISEETNLLDELVSDLYSVLGCQKAMDLYGLSQVAE